ncbi:MAG: hypothetical protein A2901_02310 [Elusimicrobia bacterium RIFCSPLOWO2_01_FULL_54_10]|nr:MAG: hypothetical protein A2901_02310 [Elusimicrobia bacterium RIFCSPLOWO2_01_FULL_54_10]
MKAQKRKRNSDEQVREFETRDLGKDIKKLHVIRPEKISTSIVLDPVMITRLQSKAKKRGIGYQTMMKIIVYENINRY